MLIGGIGEAAKTLQRTLAHEAPEFERFWTDIGAHCDGLLAASTPPLPGVVEDLADRIARAFGVSMGSLSDLVLWRDDGEERRRANSQLTTLRCKLRDLALRLR